MKLSTLFTLVALVGLIALAPASTAQTGSLKELAQFPGNVLKWVHIAEPVLRKEGLNEDDYNISVIDGVQSMYVSFEPLDVDERTRGGGGFEVEISKRSMKVTKAHYER